MLEGCTSEGSNGSITMRPASISERMVRSLRTTAGAVYSRSSRQSASRDVEVPISRPMEEQSHYVKRSSCPAARRSRSSTSRMPTLPDDVSSFGPAVEPDQELHVCAECASELVYPTAGRRPARAPGRSSFAAPSARRAARASSARTTVDDFDERAGPGHRRPHRRPSPPHAGPTWPTRSTSSSRRSRPTRSCPKTSRPCGLGVALHHAVGHQVAAPACRWPRGSSRSAQRRLRLRHVDQRLARAHSPSAPVLAIRSHTASAWAGSVTTSRRSISRQLGVALARDDQRQRDRAVQQVRAAVLAGALGRARHVEHVVEDLEGQADAPAEASQARPRAGRRVAEQRAQAAGRGEQAGRLQLAALQVALGASRESDHASARCISSPRASAEEAADSAATAVLAAGRGQLGEGAREEQVAGGRGGAAAAGREHRRHAAAQRAPGRARRRAPAWPCAAARPPPPPASSAVARRRRRGTRAPAAAACRRRPSVPEAWRPSSAPWRLGHLGQARLGALQLARELRAARLQHRGELRRRRSWRAPAPCPSGWR